MTPPHPTPGFARRCKGAVVRLLPAPVRAWLRRRYYPGLLRRFREEQWPPACVVRRLVRPGDAVADVGANVGYVTALLARWTGPGGTVHSVEPVPATARLLRHGVRRLGLASVRVHGCAASSADGEAVMRVPRYPWGGENFYEASLDPVRTADDPGAVEVRVQTRRLDAVLADDLDRVRFLKIDVEGHERAALAGAAELLRRSRPALLVEVSGDPDDPSGDAGVLLRELADQGYRAYVLRDGGLTPRQHGDRPVDLFFLTEEQRAGLEDGPDEAGGAC